MTRAIVLDTDFLSSFLKIDRLSLIRDFYAVETLLVPPAVYHQVSRTKLVEGLAALPWIHIEPPGIGSVLLEDDPRLGRGELEAIALAGQRVNSLLLTNDNRALEAAREAGLDAVDIPAFLLSCKISGFLEREQILSLIRDLREKDRYGFRKEVLDLLLS